MLAEKKKNTNIGVGGGFVLQIIGKGMAFSGDSMAIMGSVIALLGLILFIWGCFNYAEGKGHSKFLGLLGILSCIGLIILVVLPDKHKEG